MQSNMKTQLIDRPNLEHTINGVLVSLETERLLIRSYDKSDFELMRELYKDPLLTRYYDFGKPLSEAEIRNIESNKGIHFFRKGLPFGLFSIFLKETHEFLGQIDFMPFNFEAGIYEIGFILLSKYQHNGYCTEAVKYFLKNYADLIVENSFFPKKIQIHKIIATAHPENHASINVLKRAGMTLFDSKSRFGAERFWFSYNV
jgi:ribosomal-protein-alanine N-acetyltransferase